MTRGAANNAEAESGVRYRTKYFYDRVGRLTRAEVLPQAGAPSDARLDVEEYAYDPFGNMTRRTILSPAGRGATEAFALAFEPGAVPGTAPSGDGSPNRNRIAARALYDGSGNAIMDNGAPRAAQDVEYDLDGNAVRLPGKLRQTVGASWDALGRMTTFVEGDPKTELGAPAETYRYAADGFRWLRAGADGKATLTLRDAQGRPLAEYVVARGGAGPTLSREYVHALGQVVAERAWTGGTQTTTYHHRDHLGSLRVATDAAGALADAHDYYPFGGEMGPVASSSRKKFTGHERDEETGLDYMLARYYPGSMGRFLSVDPGFDVQPESPQSWNLYGYVGNNPVNAIDSDGRTEKSALQLIRDNAGAITLAAAVATYVTNVPVKAEEIARIVYEENRNDFNIVRGNDSNVLNRISQGLGVGGPEVKNAVGEELMRKGLSNADRSFGICEMKISTAAKALGMDPAKLADFQKIQILNLLNDNTTAVLLAGLHLAHLRAANPNVPIEGLLTLYNSGKWTGKVSEVAARSGPKLPEIRKALGE